MSVSRVGKTKNLITLQNAVLSTDSMGGFTTARTTYVTAYAKMTPNGGKEIFSDKTGRQIENPHTYEFLIRFNGTKNAITTNMRIKFGTRTFNIVKINDENDNNNYITLEAIEDVAN